MWRWSPIRTRIKDNVNAPTLLTLHAAKGLEFGAVFIVGLDDGILPHSRSFDEPEEMEEERRLFYVGITRAKDRLYLLRAMQRGGRGYAEETYPSRFLDDIPEDLLVGKSRTGRGLARPPRRDRSGPPHRASQLGLHSWKPDSAPGTRVKHPMWGEGIVLDSRSRMTTRSWTSCSNRLASRRLAASLANLSIL